MNSATLEEPPVTPFAVTMADVITRLGDIPPSRILMNPTPGTATEEDQLACGNKYVELIDGTLVEKAMGYPASVMTMALGYYLFDFIFKHNLGRLTSPDLIVSFGVNQNRLPDISFFSRARLPRGAAQGNIATVTPDLTVEVLSDGNTVAEMKSKRKQYFDAGVLLVWMVNPKKRTVVVYTSETEFTELTEADTLTGGDVLPGFTLPLDQLFQHCDPSE